MSIFPEENKYMDDSKYLKISKIPEGEELKIRFLGEGIVGWEDWTKDKKPVRYRAKEAMPPIDPEKPLKKFFASVVWNYTLEKIQILSLTQKKVKDALMSLEEKKGPATGYDIKIIKTGEGKNSVYTVLGCPATSLNRDLQSALAQTPIRLEALYEGKDPFKDLEGIKVDEQTGEVPNSSPVGSPLETLREYLVVDDIDSSFLDEYIDSLAEKKETASREDYRVCLDGSIAA